MSFTKHTILCVLTYTLVWVLTKIMIMVVEIGKRGECHSGKNVLFP